MRSPERLGRTFALPPTAPAPRRMSSRGGDISSIRSARSCPEPTKDFGEASLEELANIQVYSASKHMRALATHLISHGHHGR